MLRSFIVSLCLPWNFPLKGCSIPSLYHSLHQIHPCDKHPPIYLLSAKLGTEGRMTQLLAGRRPMQTSRESNSWARVQERAKRPPHRGLPAFAPGSDDLKSCSEPCTFPIPITWITSPPVSKTGKQQRTWVRMVGKASPFSLTSETRSKRVANFTFFLMGKKAGVANSGQRRAGVSPGPMSDLEGSPASALAGPCVGSRTAPPGWVTWGSSTGSQTQGWVVMVIKAELLWPLYHWRGTNLFFPHSVLLSQNSRHESPLILLPLDPVLFQPHILFFRHRPKSLCEDAGLLERFLQTSEPLSEQNTPSF